MSNAEEILLEQSVLYLPSVIGALLGMLFTGYNEKAIWIGFGIGFIAGAVMWWFMQEYKGETTEE
jgi:zinc transporter ZupT